MASDFDLDLMARNLNLDFTKPLEKALREELNQAIKDVATAACNQINAKARLRLGSLRNEYLATLEKLGKNSYLIVLEGDFANKLEDGIPAHNMKETMLASKANVSVGPNAGQPWVHKGAEGQRYAFVPFQHHPYAKEPMQAAHYGKIIQGLTTQNRQGLEQRITQIFKNSRGTPLEGKVASIADTGFRDLDNLTKFQKVGKSASGRTTVQATYMTWRTISDKSPDGKWQNPGRPPLSAFLEAEKYVEDQLNEILKAFLG